MTKLRFFRNGSAGFTVVELLVAMVVTAIVSGAAMSIFTAQQKNFVRDRNIKEIGQDAQDGLRFLASDLMEGGFSVQSSMAFYIQDGGSTRSDKIFINDTSLITILPPSDWPTSDIPTSMERLLRGSCPGCMSIVSGSGTNSVLVDTLNVSGSNDLIGGVSGYVISDGGTNKIAMISSISGNTLALDRGLTGTRLAPAIYYCVDDGNTDCHPSSSSERGCLRRSDKSSGGRQVMVDNVADIQVAYLDGSGNWYGETGCDNTGVGTGFCEMRPFDSSQIRLIRLSVVLRSKTQERETELKNDPARCRPTVENRPGATPGDATECGHIYRSYEVVLQPRNAG